MPAATLLAEAAKLLLAALCGFAGATAVDLVAAGLTGLDPLETALATAFRPLLVAPPLEVACSGATP